MIILLLKAYQPDLFAEPTQVRGYTRTDGTAVRPHTAMVHKKDHPTVDIHAKRVYYGPTSKEGSKMKLTVESMPMTASAIRHPDRFSQALDVLNRASAGDVVRKKEVDNAKDDVSREVENAGKKHISEPYLYAGKWQALPSDVRDALDSVPWNLHAVSAFAKRIEKVKTAHPAIDTARALISEWMPVRDALEHAKGVAVKGRAPSAGPSKPVNTDKVVKTCPVCMRPIAVQHNVMVHHGYQRPGWGFQTNSCPAAKRFKPLEISDEGVRWAHEWHAEVAANIRQKLAEKDKWESIPVSVRAGSAKSIKFLYPGDAGWERAVHSQESRLQYEAQQHEASAKHYADILSKWKPTE